MAFICCFVRDHHVAEDMFQEVGMRLFSAEEAGGQDINDVAKWCRGVAKNLILHYWRNQQRSRVTADMELLDLAGLAFDEQDSESALWRQREEALRACMEDLPERSSHALRLKYHSRLSIDSIARQIGGTIASVSMLLSRIRYRLGDCIEQRLKRDGGRP